MAISPKNSRQEQAAETKQAIISVAVKLFAEKGYAATGVREICRSAGLADGLLYHYFPLGKVELLQQIIIKYSKLILSDMQAYLNSIENLPLEELFESYYYHSIEIFEEHQDALNIIFRETSTFDMEERHQIFREIQLQSTRWLPKLLEKRAKAGEISEIDYECAAISILPVLLSSFFNKLIGLNNISTEKDENFFKRIITFHISMWKNNKKGDNNK